MYPDFVYDLQNANVCCEACRAVTKTRDQRPDFEISQGFFETQLSPTARATAWKSSHATHSKDTQITKLAPKAREKTVLTIPVQNRFKVPQVMIPIVKFHVRVSIRGMFLGSFSRLHVVITAKIHFSIILTSKHIHEKKKAFLGSLQTSFLHPLLFINKSANR